MKLLAQSVGGGEEEGGAREVGEPVNDLVALAGARCDGEEVGARGGVVEGVAELGGSVLRREKLVESVALLLLELTEKGEEGKEGAMEVGEPETELAELGNREAFERAARRFARLAHHAVGVRTAARAPGGVADDDGSAFRVEARSAKSPSERARAAIVATGAPTVGREVGEGLDQIMIGLVIGRNFRTRTFLARSRRFGLFRGPGTTRARRGSRSFRRGKKIELLEESERIESEPLVEDDGGERVELGATARGVLQVEEAVGLGVEAEERDGRSAVGLVELAVEAEQLAKEASKSAVERAEKGLFPGVGGGLVPGVRVEERSSEPEDEVPAGVTAGEEVVADAELGEKLVHRLPGPLSVAVEEDGVKLDGFGIAAARVEALGVGEDAALAFRVDLLGVVEHPGGELAEGARPGGAEARA